MSDSDDAVAVVVVIFIAAGLFAYVLLAVLAIALIVGLLWGLWRLAAWAWSAVRGPSEVEQIDEVRDAAVRDLIALRQQAVREMVEVSHGEFIEGTAREVERR
ncbi:MAG: hypothetical protein EPN91_06010 [Salinibacterium sp.]|nr:MAG: hypothetical protein EPN91_06010 [Salinibacterium sp.]